MEFYDDDLYDVFSVVFHHKCIIMHMCLNETEHIYTISPGFHMMIYMCFLLRYACMLVFPEVVECLYIYEYNLIL
jgi:hypothetical protein